jgi:isoleucyl-tRNA synthetase
VGLISSTSSIVCHVGEGGLFTNDVAHVVGKEAGQRLVEQPVLDNGSRAIVGLLKDMKRLLKIERFKHRYPYDWKTDEPIIVTYVQNFNSLRDPYMTLIHIGRHRNGSPTWMTSSRML